MFLNEILNIKYDNDENKVVNIRIKIKHSIINPLKALSL
jgi:hypothetical protein